jgi:hypothetical protein
MSSAAKPTMREISHWTQKLFHCISLNNYHIKIYQIRVIDNNEIITLCHVGLTTFL